MWGHCVFHSLNLQQHNIHIYSPIPTVRLNDF